MENKKELKKKRVPAPKTNTCIKWHHLGRTATALTLEELGLLYFMLQVVDDTKEVRYELIADDFTKELLIEKEQEYIKLFDKTMKENPVFRILFESHAGQIKTSRKYYESLVQRIEENNDLVDGIQGTSTTETPKAKTETPETTETTTETPETEENYYTYKNGILDINTDLINQKIKSLNTKYTETEISEYVSLSVHHQKKDLFNQYGYMTFGIEEIIEQMKEDGFPCPSDVFKEEEGPF